jgi:DNA mismatch endonuclease (patch repair protein)
MPDVFAPWKRSAVMRKIRSTDTKPELRIRSALFRRGLRFRVDVRSLPGRPDIVLPKFKTAIQVRGCFWHSHTCHDGHLPKSSVSYWSEKLAANVARDQISDARLREAGWTVINVWECECASATKLAATVEQILERLRSVKRSISAPAASVRKPLQSSHGGGSE